MRTEQHHTELHMCAHAVLLCLQVCSRLGMNCGVKVVEEGRYCLVWPRPAAAPHEEQEQHQRVSLQQAPGQQQQQDAAAGAGQQEVQQLLGTYPQRQTLLSVGGDACVVDVYGEGALLPVREVRAGPAAHTAACCCQPF